MTSTMTTNRSFVLGVAALLLVAAPVSAAGQQVWRATYPLTAGGDLALESVHGGIWIEGWDRAEVEVTAFKRTAGNPSDLEKVEVKVDSGADWLTLRTVYRGQTDQPVRVDFRLRVPRQVQITRIGTVQGDIYLRALEGPVRAQTLSGNITGVDLAGETVFHATNGNVSASFRALPEADEAVVLDTLNGNVTVVLPPGSNADLLLKTVAGQTETPFAWKTSLSSGGQRARVRAGRGGVEIRLSTVRGDVRVLEKPTEM